MPLRLIRKPKKCNSILSESREEGEGLEVGSQKTVEKVKDSDRIRRIGPDKGGHWEIERK